MYIEPNTNIKFYKNVPLDNTYEHTLYFASKTAQDNYFHNTPAIVIASLTRNSYQRVVKGRMRVALRAEQLYSCNYLAFQNASFGTKWFYAFVLGVEYINNETCEVQFEIDSIQTYLFDITFKQCLVEREHTVSDNIGEHYLDEGHNGAYITQGYDDLAEFQSYCVLVGITWEHTPFGNNRVDGEPCYIDLMAFSITDYRGYNALRVLLEGRADDICFIQMCPSCFFDWGTDEYQIVITHYDETSPQPLYTFKSNDISHTVSLTNYTRFEGYTPKNNKLYCYPYSRYLITNNQGGEIELKPELLENYNSIPVNIYNTINGTVNSKLCVKGYNIAGSPSAYVNFYQTLELTNFPTLAWTSDTFQSWLRENKNQNDINQLSLKLNMIKSFTTPTTLGTGISLTNAITSQMQYEAKIKDIQEYPNTERGSSSNSNANIKKFLNTFTFYIQNFRKEKIIAIDNYFSKFGYKVMELKTPSFNNRPHWTFVKTQDCKVVGGCPTDDLAKISNILDNGITFWNNASEVGNYSLDNSPS